MISCSTYTSSQSFEVKRKHSRAEIDTYSFERTTLGARDFPGAVSGFCQVLIVTPAKSLRPKMCQSSANTENSRRTREKPLVPSVWEGVSFRQDSPMGKILRNYQSEHTAYFCYVIKLKRERKTEQTID